MAKRKNRMTSDHKWKGIKMFYHKMTEVSNNKQLMLFWKNTQGKFKQFNKFYEN